MTKITIGTRAQTAVLVESSDEDREAVSRTQDIIEYFRRALESENDPDAMIRLIDVNFSIRDLEDVATFLNYLDDALNCEQAKIVYSDNGFEDTEARHFGDNYSYINPEFAALFSCEDEGKCAECHIETDEENE